MNIVERPSLSTQCPESARSVELDHGQSITLGGASIKVVYGGVWLVGAKRADDYLIDGDDGAMYVARGSTISAVGKSRVDIVDVDCAALLRCWLLRVRQRLGWRPARSQPRSTAGEA